MGPFLIGFIAPLVVYLVKGPESEFIKFQSREALNFQIMMLIGWIAATVLTVVFIGFALFAVLIVFHFVFPIMAAVKSNTGEPYRYPVSIRFIS